MSKDVLPPAAPDGPAPSRPVAEDVVDAWSWAERTARATGLSVDDATLDAQHQELMAACARLAAAAPLGRAPALRAHGELLDLLQSHLVAEEEAYAATPAGLASHRREHASVLRTVRALSGLAGGDPADLEAGARDAAVLLLDHFVRWDLAI